MSIGLKDGYRGYERIVQCQDEDTHACQHQRDDGPRPLVFVPVPAV